MINRSGLPPRHNKSHKIFHPDGEIASMGSFQSTPMGSMIGEARIPIANFGNIDLSAASPGNQSSPVTNKNEMLLGK